MLSTLLWFFQPAESAAPAATNAAEGAAAAGQALPMGGCAGQAALISVMFVVIYFLMIRPSQKQQKRQEDMLKALQKGDKVRTQSGILGEVIEIYDNDLLIQLELLSEKNKDLEKENNLLRSQKGGGSGGMGGFGGGMAGLEGANVQDMLASLEAGGLSEDLQMMIQGLGEVAKVEI